MNESFRWWRFRPHLRDRGIAKSWAGLKYKIKHHNFPPGRLLTPQMRAWTPEEVIAWESRKVEPGALRGAAASPEARKACGRPRKLSAPAPTTAHA
jgi:hypothetical protein